MTKTPAKKTEPKAAEPTTPAPGDVPTYSRNPDTDLPRGKTAERIHGKPQ